MIQLPVEILRQIIEKIKDTKTLSLVCKKLYIVCNQVKWKSLTLFMDNFSKFDKIKKLFQLNILSLSIIAYDKSLQNKNFSKFLTKCTNLVNLFIHLPIINDDDLWLISKYCSGLRDIKVESEYNQMSKITDQGIQNLVLNLKLKGFNVKVNHAKRGNKELLISKRYVFAYTYKLCENYSFFCNYSAQYYSAHGRYNNSRFAQVIKASLLSWCLPRLRLVFVAV